MRRAVALVALSALAACHGERATVGTSPTTTEAPTTSSTTATSTPTTPTTPPSPPSTEPAAATITTAPQPADPVAPRQPLANADGANAAFNGIGQLRGFGTTCTAFLLDVGEPADPAYAMSNGRCVGIVDSTTVVRDQPAEGASVTFGQFADTPSDHAEVAVRTVRYATMRGTDVAILELAATRRDLAGLTSYDLADPPADGTPIRVVGIPVAGLDETQWTLRGATCTAGPPTRLVESVWLWDAAVSSDCAGILGGGSGSPVFAADDATTVVAIVTTTMIGAAPTRNCSLGAPCELAATGAVHQPDRTYAMPVGAWGACFGPRWDPTARGCPTEREPVTVTTSRRAVQPGGSWAALIAGPTIAVGVKAGPGGTTDCRDPAGYALSTTGATYDAPLPPDEGVYVLCAATLDADLVAATADAGSAVMEVDGTRPDAPIQLSTVPLDDAVQVEPISAPPEYASFLVKVGSPASTRCGLPGGYVPYRGVAVEIRSDQLPARFCVVGTDEAGNHGLAQSLDVP
jgi:hypothetical protein